MDAPHKAGHDRKGKHGSTLIRKNRTQLCKAALKV